MTRARLIGLAVAATLLGSVAAIADRGEVWSVNANLEELLSGIDFVPSRLHFDEADVADTDLIEIARDADADAGHRIRAYRALAHYPGESAEKALEDAIPEHGEIAAGVDTIYVRAAMHSLAVVARELELLEPGHSEAAVAVIQPMLDHPSRDVRADAARAMGACEWTDAIPALHERLNHPGEVAQVKIALAEAIRALTALL